MSYEALVQRLVEEALKEAAARQGDEDE
jgi:hypothetical protein